MKVNRKTSLTSKKSIAKAKASAEAMRQAAKLENAPEAKQGAPMASVKANLPGKVVVSMTETRVEPVAIVNKPEAKPVSFLETPLARKSGLRKLVNPTLEQAREFFDWTIEKTPIYRADGSIIEDWNEFKSSKGHTLHVGQSYNPAQPLIAFDKTVQALNELNQTFDVNGAGSFDNDRQIFAQFAVNGKTTFDIGGKAYAGFVTMGKGNDETMPLSYWLTLVCIVCANTWRAAKRDLRKAGNKGEAVIMKQTKHSESRLEAIQNEIKSLFEYQETVRETLQRMAQMPIQIGTAERAFLGLLKGETEGEMKQTGRTRLQNTLERYRQAYVSSPGVNGGETVEDWFNAVTNVDTHGDQTSKRFDAGKQWLSSEFGTYATRKERAFELAGNPQTWDKLVADGDAIMNQLLARPVIVPAMPASVHESKLGNEFQALLNN